MLHYFRSVLTVYPETDAVLLLPAAGIRACYDNEAAIRDIFPYGVPLLVTSMRILVPVIFVPLFLKLEFRTEHSQVYQSIGRSFLLKMVALIITLVCFAVILTVFLHICLTCFLCSAVHYEHPAANSSFCGPSRRHVQRHIYWQSILATRND